MITSIQASGNAWIPANNEYKVTVKSDLSPQITKSKGYAKADVGLDEDTGLAEIFLTTRFIDKVEFDEGDTIFINKGTSYQGFQTIKTKKSANIYILDIPFDGEKDVFVQEAFQNFRIVGELVDSLSKKLSEHTKFTKITKQGTFPRGEFEFDFSEDMQNEIEEYEVLNLNQDGGRKMQSIFKRFNLRFTEKYTNSKGVAVSGAVKFLYDPDNFVGRHFLNAGLQYEENRDLQFYFSKPFYGTRVMWLTNAFGDPPLKNIVNKSVGVKVIGLEESEELSFIKFSQTQYTTRRVEFKDSAGAITRVDKQIFTDGESGRMSVQVGTRHLNPPSGTVSYRVRMIDDVNTVGLTLWVEYIIDSRCYDNSVRFKWINPLGAEDSYTFIGSQEDVMVSERRILERDLPERNSTKGQYEVIENKAHERFTANTGMIDTETAKWLREICQAKFVWVEALSNDIKNRLYRKPVIITSSNVNIHDSLEPLSNVSFTYRNAYDKV